MSFLFNAVIDGLDLRELVMSGRQFTWANARDIPTFEKLDRVLMSTEWETKFPLSSVTTHSRDISDHTPLILNTGEASTTHKQPLFKFELGWFLRDGFQEMVKNVWLSENSGSTPLERWQAKIRRLRQHLRGWAKHTSGILRREKKDLLDKLDSLDKKAELAPLSPQELESKNAMKEVLARILREEEIKWYQQSKTKGLLEGDANTRYFHLIANGKH
jgi:hypothetical protein